ncbi:PUA-like domain-containing protein [Irpex rosettiformis]|uniref:PUA-like domain-containing protein n=1 Tax=Irpex rosettiformis TaxID=378272 RepID=A0ACB8TXX5_9APHY|nr:PUA-like domain-containing protein [Irpex rosettiformis]
MASKKSQKMKDEEYVCHPIICSFCQTSECSPALNFGPVPRIKVGKWWAYRKDCSADRVHPPFIAGIYGRKDDGARSIVLSGGSEFADEDNGETFEYVGSGGRAPGIRFGSQTEDQSWDNNSNAALRRSAQLNRPVRVIRGAGDSQYTPYHGYRYDGLYLVTRPRREAGPNGFKICKFTFTRMPNQDPLPTDRGPRDVSDIAARRRQYLQTVPRQKAGSSKKRQTTASSRGASSSGDDEDEDNSESLFTAREDVEEALWPVLPQLAEFSRSGNSSAEKKARRPLLLEIGRHIKAVIEEKRDQDPDWWRTQLWEFVVKATPRKKHSFTIKQYEELYEKFESQQQQQAQSRSYSPSAVASSSRLVDVNVKHEPGDPADYMLVDVKHESESES